MIKFAPLPCASHPYWNPNLKLDAEGRARVTLYNNSRATQIEVDAAGQAADGTLLWNR
ncbi:MAG: hypothetical protein IJ253_02910 [Bacteroidaceae bacterium]|nr:hypothetical protein [Bacteroidaceae bacterium]